MLGEVVEIMDSLVAAVDDVDGGHGRVPVAGNNENGSGLGTKAFLLPRLEEMSCRYRIVKGQRRRSMRYVERIHLSSVNYTKQVGIVSDDNRNDPS